MGRGKKRGIASSSNENMPMESFNIPHSDSGVLDSLSDIKSVIQDLRTSSEERHKAMQMASQERQMASQERHKAMQMASQERHEVMLSRFDGTISLEVPDQLIDLEMQNLADGTPIPMLSNSHDSRVVDFKLDENADPILPMSEEYHKPYMFVRDCFPEYYEYVKEIFESSPEIKYISITGTPGIGKSMFYNWFFNKYRSDHTDKVLVCSSFNRDRVMQRCVVFELGKNPVRHCRDIPEIDGALYLYDGPPKRVPRGRMVAFVSPNADWFRAVSEGQDHIKLYMEVWSLAELRVASKYVEFHVNPTELSERYDFFGGVPRYCLCSHRFFKQSKEALLTELKDSVKNYESMEASYSMKSSVLCHRIFHHVPAFSNGYGQASWPECTTFTVCSKQVIQELIRLVWLAGHDRRVQFIAMLRGEASLRSFMGFVFEGFCNEFFMTGMSNTISMVEYIAQLCRDPKKPAWKQWLNESLTLKIPHTGYSASPNMRWETVDAYAYNEEEKYLNLFQATLQARHKITGKGIVKHVKWMESELGIQELEKKILTKDIKLRFIFLIPENTERYSRQEPEEYTTADARRLCLPLVNDDIPENMRDDDLSATTRVQRNSCELWKKILDVMPQYYFELPDSSIYKS